MARLLARLKTKGHSLSSRVRALAWEESKHPRHPKGSDKGGEFAPVQEGPNPGGGNSRHTWENYDPNKFSSATTAKVQGMHSELDRVWSYRSGNPSYKDDVYVAGNSASKNLRLSFAGKFEEAFNPRRGVEDDDHPDVLPKTFAKVKERLTSIANRWFPGAEVRVSPEEKYTISIDVKLPASSVLSSKLNLK